MASELKVLITGDGSKLRQELVKTASEVNKVERETQRASRELKNMQGIANNAASSFTRMFSSIKTGDIRGISDSFTQLGGNINSLLPNLGQLGPALVNPWVLAGTAIAGAGAAFVKYNAELEKTLQRTEQFTGLTGNALYSLRNGIKSVADTFGKDFNDVLSSVDGLMAQFHIDGETALNIIRDGFVGGVDDGGKMFEMISKYSGAFNDAGISARELVAIIGNTRSGIFSEEGMELFSKGAMKIREFSSSLQSSLEAVGINATEMYNKLQSGEITTVQAIQQISQHLKGLSPQSQEVGNVMKDVFGKKAALAGYELVTALADVETDLSKIKTQTGDWGMAMEELQEADRELENALASMFGLADSGFSTMTTRLKADVYGAIAKVINAFIDLYNKNILFRSSVASLTAVFKNSWEIIKGILKIFMSSLQGLADMIQGVLELDWNKVKSGWKNGISNVLKTVADGFENIKNNSAAATEQALHGQIERVTVEPVSTQADSNVVPSRRTSNGSKSEKSDNSKKSETKAEAKKEIKTPDAGSIADLENKLRSINDELNNTNVSDDNLQQLLLEKKAIEEQIDTLKIRNGLKEAPQVKVEPVLQEGSLAWINKELSDKQAQLQLEVVGSEKYKELTKQISELTGQKNEIELQVKSDTLDEATKKTNELKEAQERAREVAALNQQGYQALSSTFGSLGSAIGETAGKFLELAGQTIASIGQIIPQIVALIGVKQSEALASGTASAAGLPFPANIAAIASIIATITALFASFAGSFASGGIIGGATTIGDYNLARVNKGEMILNGRQQSKLFNMLNGNGFYSTGNIDGSSVSFKIQGKDLVGVLNNYNKKASRVM